MAHPRWSQIQFQNPPYIVTLQWSGGVQRLYKPQGYNGCMQTRHNVSFFFVLFFHSSVSQEREDAPWSTAANHSVFRMGHPVCICSQAVLKRESAATGGWIYICIERDHYRTMAFRRYGHFYTHRSPAQTLLRWEDVPHAGDTHFLPTVFLLVLWGREEWKKVNMLSCQFVG